MFLSDTISSTDLYTDNTTVYDAQVDLNILETYLQTSPLALHNWWKQNGMLLNTEKSKLMLITTRQKRQYVSENILSLSYNHVKLQVTTGDKIQGVNMDENLLWNNHYQVVCEKASSYIWLLSRISHYLSPEHELI